jgi:hypothetical protein
MNILSGSDERSNACSTLISLFISGRMPTS